MNHVCAHATLLLQAMPDVCICYILNSVTVTPLQLASPVSTAQQHFFMNQCRVAKTLSYRSIKYFREETKLWLT